MDIPRLPHCARDTSLIIISTQIQRSSIVINTCLNQSICSVIEDLKMASKYLFPKKERQALILATSPVSPLKGRASETTSLELETFASLGSRLQIESDFPIRNRLNLMQNRPKIWFHTKAAKRASLVSGCKLSSSCCQHVLKLSSSCWQHVLKLLSKCHKAVNKLQPSFQGYQH